MSNIEGGEISEGDVLQDFGGTYAGRGEDYQREGRVNIVSFDPDKLQLIAAVQGAQANPYRVEVKFGTAARIADVRCTCPMSGFCKHSAAAVYDAIRKGLIGSDPQDDKGQAHDLKKST